MLKFFMYEPASYTWYDKSNEVESINDIPFLEMTDEKEIVASILQCKINSTIDSSFMNSTTEVEIRDDSVGKFYGLIKLKKYNVNDKCWELEIYNALIKLDDVRLTRTNFYPTLSNTADRGMCGSDSSGFDSCNVVWLIDRMMYHVGLPYNISSLYTKTSANFVGTYHSYNHYLVDMRIDLGMLWCLNQQYATTYDRLENNSIEGYKAADLYLTLYQLLQALTGLFNICIRYESGVFVFYRKQHLSSLDEYSISQDDIYKYDETIEKDKLNNRSMTQITYLSRTVFNSYTSDYVLNHTDSFLGSNGLSNKSFINNLYFLVRYGGGADNLWDVWVSFFTYHISCLEFPLSYNYSRYSPFLSTEKYKKWTIPYQSSNLQVLEHFVDVKNKDSKIKQGWY